MTEQPTSQTLLVVRPRERSSEGSYTGLSALARRSTCHFPSRFIAQNYSCGLSKHKRLKHPEEEELEMFG